MRQFSTLIICTLVSLVAFGQDMPSPSEPSPTPEASPEPKPAPEAKEAPVSDRDFITLPDQTTLSGETINAETAVSITPDAPISDPNALLPSSSSEIPDAAAVAVNNEAQERKIKVRYKQVRLEADQDSNVTALLDKAKKATTFEGERAAYREYYRALFRRMKKIDSSIAKKCDEMEKAYLNRLAQTRIEPTIPLEPPPNPKPLAN